MSSDEDPYSYDYQPVDKNNEGEFVNEPIDNENENKKDDYEGLDDFYQDNEDDDDLNLPKEDYKPSPSYLGQGNPEKKKKKRDRNSGGLSLGVFGDKQINLGFVKISLKDIPLPLFDPKWFQKLIHSDHPWMIITTLIGVFTTTFLAIANSIVYLYMVVLFVLGSNVDMIYIFVGLFCSVLFCVTIPCICCIFKYVPVYKATTSDSIFIKAFYIVFLVTTVLSILFSIWMILGIVGSAGVIDFFLFIRDLGSKSSLLYPVLVLYGLILALIFGWCCTCIFTDGLVVLYYGFKILKQFVSKAPPEA